MFLQTRNSLLTRPLVAPAISRRLLSSRPNILPKNGSTNISKFAIAAGCFVVGGATTVATVVCEQDRMERWNDRWATGNVVRPLILTFIVHECAWYFCCTSMSATTVPDLTCNVNDTCFGVLAFYRVSYCWYSYFHHTEAFSVVYVQSYTKCRTAFIPGRNLSTLL